jgi:hypothetical protein
MPRPVVEAPLDKLARLHELQVQAARVEQVLLRYYDDPAGFARDCIAWPEGSGLDDYQAEILDAIPKRMRVAVRGPHGLGKTMIEAIATLWFVLTREAAGVDWKVATTAGSWHQLTQYLWPEVHKWAGRLRWQAIRATRFTRDELQNLNLKLPNGNAFAAASQNAALIEGAHATALLFVYDESKAIPAATFDACEGALSGTGEAFALAFSTPGARRPVLRHPRPQARLRRLVDPARLARRGDRRAPHRPRLGRPAGQAVGRALRDLRQPGARRVPRRRRRQRRPPRVG